MRFKHSISKRQFDGRITVFIVIFISISLCSRSLPSNEVKGSPTPYGEIYAQAEHTNSSPSSEHVAATPTSSGFSTSNLVSRNVDAVLLIDNSGSMDWPGHDPEGNRFESAKIFIDKLEEGDNIALIDFSSSSEIIIPLTEVTEARKSMIKSIASKMYFDRKLTNINSALELALQELSSSRANPAHMAAVILFTDGEIDVVLGTLKEKRRAAQTSEEMLFSQILPKYIQSYIPIYTVALGERANVHISLKNIIKYLIKI